MPAHPRRSLLARAAVGATAAVLALTSLAACGSDDSTDPTSDATVTATSSATHEPTGGSSGTPTTDVDARLAITMTGSKVDPAPDTFKVDEGDRVSVTITRDTAGEVHIHGYELHADAKAGVPVVFEFVADQTGGFDIEAHSPDVLLSRLQVS